MAKKRILLIDDESGFTRLLKLALPAFEIIEENDPSKALETAGKTRPDLIFLDVIMPEVDGGTLSGQFRANPRLSHIPIVFITAIVKPGEVQQIDGRPVLAKPISREKIVACIEEHLGV